MLWEKLWNEIPKSAPIHEAAAAAAAAVAAMGMEG